MLPLFVHAMQPDVTILAWKHLLSGINKKKSSDSIVGISSLTKISLIRLQGAGLIDRKGTIGRIFSSLAKANINIKLISQTFSEHSICFAINPKWNEWFKNSG